MAIFEQVSKTYERLELKAAASKSGVHRSETLHISHSTVSVADFIAAQAAASRRMLPFHPTDYVTTEINPELEDALLVCALPPAEAM